MKKIKDRINDDVFIEVCKTSKTMAEASRKLGIHFNSFLKRAKELNCYNPNPAGIGINKKAVFKYKLDDILTENSVYKDTVKLKNRLIKTGLKENKCEKCGINSWLDLPLSLHLHHIDGDNSNNTLENLEILCPNCHSQTDNYCSKNKNLKIINTIKDINDIKQLDRYDVEKYKPIKKIKNFKNTCTQCGKDTNNITFCSNECRNIYNQKNIPNKEQLIEDIHKLKSKLQISKKYKVSDNTIKKWIIKYNLIELCESYQYNKKKEKTLQI